MAENEDVIDGERAREMCRALLVAIGPSLPDGVRVNVRGKGKYTRLSGGSRPEPPPPGGVRPVRFGGGAWCAIPFFGRSPFPLFDRMSAAEHAEAAMRQALEEIQGVVAAQVGQDWPSSGAVVRSSSDDTHVDLWFESDSGRQPAAHLPIALGVRYRRWDRRRLHTLES